MKIVYRNDAVLDVDKVINLYCRCSLRSRRPVDNKAAFEKMINNANLIISAWHSERLVGMARCLSDLAVVTYLADLVVDEDYQRQGIGKQLIKEVQRNTDDNCKIVLLAAPTANDYYPKLGFESNPRAWFLNKPLVD